MRPTFVGFVERPLTQAQVLYVTGCQTEVDIGSTVEVWHWGEDGTQLEIMPPTRGALWGLTSIPANSRSSSGMTCSLVPNSDGASDKLR